MITVFHAAAQCQALFEELLDSRANFYDELVDVTPGVGLAPVTVNGAYPQGDRGVLVDLGYDRALPIRDDDHPVRGLVRDALADVIAACPELASFEVVCRFDDGDARHAVEVCRHAPTAAA
jgi:hypothetical protein